MVLLREVIGDALRARRRGQHRTLRDVSSAANVSLGYLSEIERGQKEASSELLAAICNALGARLSEVLRDVSDTLALAEQIADVPVPEPVAVRPGDGQPTISPAAEGPKADRRPDNEISVSVRQDSPFKATLRATRRLRSSDRDRDVVCVG
ncbi:MAG TPA: helix-turn-helix transcriptional regulator [Micromonosporaceae bacterium]